jgi:hypothetical protein
MRARRLVAALLLLTTPGAAPFADALPAGAGAEAAQARKSADDSFLFSSATLRLLEAARAGGLLAAVPVVGSRPAPAGSLHLAAIVYQAADDWRIWLNGQSFTPAARPGPIEILKVTADRVVLAWRRDPGAPPIRVELRPNQTYLAANGEVVEGTLESRH